MKYIEKVIGLDYISRIKWLSLVKLYEVDMRLVKAKRAILL